MNVFFSNRIELLYERLKQNLFSNNFGPFTKRIIINPSPSMKNWIFNRMADDLGVAMGVEVLSPEEIISKFHKGFISKPNQKVPSHLELTMAIESEIRKGLLKNENPNLQPLRQYLIGNDRQFTRKGERRCTALAQKLASLFYQYGKFAGQMVNEWETSESGGWQGYLWRKLFQDRWTYFYRELDKDFDQTWEVDAQLHIFAMSYLAPLEHRFFCKVSEFLPVNYYLLTPCSTFWSDLLTEREREHVLQQGKRRGFSEAQQQSLEQYLVVGNPLLANSGKLGRSMAWQIEESGVSTYSDYSLPAAVAEHSVYHDSLDSDLILDDNLQPLTVLHSLQADMALLRDPDKSEKLLFPTYDGSIQIHSAATPLREVQILHDVIIGLIQRHLSDEQPICPGDVLVMAPDITAYAPYIKRVFAEEGEKLNYQMMDLHPLMQNPLIQGFLHLLQLPFGRWDTLSVLELFEHPAFQARHQLKFDDVQTIKKWIKAAEVRWGEDAAHRAELLEREYNYQVSQTSQGTWSQAVDRLLMGLVMQIDQSESFKTSFDLPINTEMSHRELLEKWISLMRSLREDLKVLTNGSYHTGQEWSDRLLHLYNNYFLMEDDYKEREKERQLLEIIEAFKFDHQLAHETFPYASIQANLEKSLSRCNVTYRENQLNAIRFCTLLPMRTIPAKVIILMGMQEGSFPKLQPRDSLNLMQGKEGVDYSPSQNDYDRFLFLETLLSARDYYILTYQGVQHPDGKEQPPSLLVSELLSYLDRSCIIADKKPSECCFFKHPFASWDQEYFREGSCLPSYSESAFKASQSFYRTEKRDPFSFVTDFHIKIEPSLSEIITIDLKQLSASARSSIQSYFNTSLRMYLEKDKDREFKNEEDFILSHIDHAFFRKQGMRLSVDDVLLLAEKSGKLPIGPFRTLTIDKLREDIRALKENLRGLGVSENSIFDIEFHDSNTVPQEKTSGGWALPPLLLDNQIKIIGKLSDVSPKGLIADIKDNKSDVLKIWPQYLALNCLIENYGLPIEKNLIFSKEGALKQSFFEDAQVKLKKYVHYYLLSLNNVSPLIPEWVPDLMTGDLEKWQKKVKSQVTSNYSAFYQDYLLWLLRSSSMPNLESIMRNWKSQADDLYTDMHHHWYSVKQ